MGALGKGKGEEQEVAVVLLFFMAIFKILTTIFKNIKLGVLAVTANYGLLLVWMTG